MFLKMYIECNDNCVGLLVKSVDVK